MFFRPFDTCGYYSLHWNVIFWFTNSSCLPSSWSICWYKKIFSYPCCVINISVHANETGQSTRRKHGDISLSSTSSYTPRTWIKWELLNVDRLFNLPSDDGSLFPDDGGSEDTGLTPPGKLQPLCIHAVRATRHNDTTSSLNCVLRKPSKSNNQLESVGLHGNTKLECVFSVWA